MCRIGFLRGFVAVVLARQFCALFTFYRKFGGKPAIGSSLGSILASTSFREQKVGSNSFYTRRRPHHMKLALKNKTVQRGTAPSIASRFQALIV